MKPVVDPAQFARIACSRCGLCCEGMYLNNDPAERLELCLYEHGHYVGMTHEETVADMRTIVDMLVVGPDHENGEYSYACRHFKRDAAGLGICTIYERRPRMCADFPYGAPANFPGCTWDVRLVKRHLPMLSPLAPTGAPTAKT